MHVWHISVLDSSAPMSTQSNDNGGLRSRKPVTNTQSTASEPNADLEPEKKPDPPNTEPLPIFREQQRGIWTLYQPVSTGGRTSLAIQVLWKSTSHIKTALYDWWRFFSEVFSLGPVVVSVYFTSLAVSSILPSIKLRNDSRLLGLAETALTGRAQHATIITEFKQAFMEYMGMLIVGWIASVLKQRSSAIVEQRVALHFEQRILAVQSRLELAPSQDPTIDAGLKSVTRHTSRASVTLSNFMDMLSAVGEVVALVPALKNQLASLEGGSSFGAWPTMYPLLWVIRAIIRTMDKAEYGKVTNQNWLRMTALHKIGTQDKYKQEVLSSGLENYINVGYSEVMSKLGDISTRGPWYPEHKWLSLDHFNQLFASLPLLFYAWSAVHNPSGFSLSAMVRMQQANGAMRLAVHTMIWRLKSISDLSNNISTLYEVLSFEPGVVDGDVPYPDEAHIEQKGMAVEFKSVTFGYPSAPNKVLKDLSFRVEPGQLCVIVGENGCGKSTTINLINRLYDCDSGEIYVDCRPIRDYKLSTLRAAINIMYQSYAYFPLTIRENLLMGHANSVDPDKHTEMIENAAKLGGAYDFIQQLPAGFETNLEPIKTGWSSPDCRVADREKFKSLAAAEKNVDFSGGQWQRLAVTLAGFYEKLRNTRLLCYDEPSASLDPKAEVGMFERLRNLKGEKTMIFVTHRFGYLTKHADLSICAVSLRSYILIIYLSGHIHT
ncbi:P-loop containing nucleoside triphosphate hydrolase protein [Rhizoctonia solani]|nr:P-loop containing nucleoside triphosphate hydrolase protein [Rhizoctonia solani]